MDALFVVEGFGFIFIAILVTLVLSVLLRSFVTTLIQVLLFVALLSLGSSGEMIFVAGVAQFVLTGMVIFKYIRAIEMNYQLILEKTHQARVNVSGDGNRGSRFSFWNTI